MHPIIQPLQTLCLGKYRLVCIGSINHMTCCWATLRKIAGSAKTWSLTWSVSVECRNLPLSMVHGVVYSIRDTWWQIYDGTGDCKCGIIFHDLSFIILTMPEWALVRASSLLGFCFEKIHSSLITDAYTVCQRNTTIFIQALQREHG